MQLVVAVIDDDDAPALMDALSQANLRATKLASTGGFLMQGNTTVLIGVEDHLVDQALRVVRQTCVRRKKLLPHAASEVPVGVNMPIEVETGGAIIFVLRVEQFYRI